MVRPNNTLLLFVYGLLACSQFQESQGKEIFCYDNTEYCDCGGDCIHKLHEFCSCPEAEACCASGGDTDTDSDSDSDTMISLEMTDPKQSTLGGAPGTEMDSDSDEDSDSDPGPDLTGPIMSDKQKSSQNAAPNTVTATAPDSAADTDRMTAYSPPPAYSDSAGVIHAPCMMAFVTLALAYARW